jgi:hypothetical protein
VPQRHFVHHKSHMTSPGFDCVKGHEIHFESVVGKMHFNEICMTIIYDFVEISVSTVSMSDNQRFVCVANRHQLQECNVADGLVPDLLMTLSQLLVSCSVKF